MLVNIMRASRFCNCTVQITVQNDHEKDEK